MDADDMEADFRRESRKGPGAAPAAPAAAPAGGPTLRERFRAAMQFRRVDRLPNFEFGYWAETLPEWVEQGLPPGVKSEAEAYRHFGIENWGGVPLNTMGLEPGFGWTVVRENEDEMIQRDNDGVLYQINKKGHKSIPHYLEFPVKGRADWEAFRERLKPGPERLAANWKEGAAALARRDHPVYIFRGSLIGKPRDWMGFEGIALAVHDDPDLLEEMVEHLCRLTCDSLARALPEMEVDAAMGWEDICFNSGPIVGAPFMRDVVLPRYRRISDLLERHGCALSMTDCDGNIMPVLDTFWRGGLNCCFPVEVNGGSDPVEIRRLYPDMRLQGGFCKMKLLQGRKAIRGELERLAPLVREGGFLPGVDHRVQAGVPLENYKYYLKLKRAMYGCGGTPEYDESKI